jgi:hypothetical protein
MCECGGWGGCSDGDCPAQPRISKRTLTLEGGSKVDCGVKEFNQLMKAIKSEEPKEIAKANLNLLMSSDKIKDELKEIFKEMNSLLK